ncbi:MAG: NAD(P)/FAD-dependent oxidoreductase [Candidatus Saccharimonas sp.]
MAKKQQFDYDVIVIGSGASGSTAALIAANAGKKVALVESETFGGETPNWGDVPSKTLLHVATLYDEARHSGRFGIRANMLSYNYPSIQRWKDRVVERTGAGGNEKYYKQQGIHTIRGIARFLTPNEITVNRKHISAERFVIATGSHISRPAISGIDAIDYLTPKSTLQLNHPPHSVVVIGGTQSGVEIAQLLATFGTKVYIIEQSSRLLPEEDEEVGDTLSRLFKHDKGMTILTQTTVLNLAKKGVGGVQVHYVRGGVERRFYVDRVIVATTPDPTVDLGLENAHVEYTPAGIDVNDHLQTSARHIYAIGHVLGRGEPTHVAFMEGRVAANNILHPRSLLKPDYSLIPRAMFIYPGVASVGLTEDDCLKRDLKVNKALVPLSMITRSNTSDFRDGFVKLISDKKGVLIGGVVVAPHAGEIIQELTVAIKHKLTATELAETPHVFLSWNEAVRLAANKLARK